MLIWQHTKRPHGGVQIKISALKPLFACDHQIGCRPRTQWPSALVVVVVVGGRGWDFLFFFSCRDLPSGLNSASPPSRVPIFRDTSDCVLMNSLNTNQAAQVQGVGQGSTQSYMKIHWVLFLSPSVITFHLNQQTPEVKGRVLASR